MDCKRCNRTLNMTEIATLRDRCLPCYHKGVKFILTQKSMEITQLERKNNELRVENDRLSRGIEVVSREWKIALGQNHLKEAGIA